MFYSNKRGFSGIITAVLIILIGISAVVIIGSFVFKIASESASVGEFNITALTAPTAPTVQSNQEITLSGYPFFGMKIESVIKYGDSINVTTTGAIYSVNSTAIQMWRRIDPKTNTDNPKKVGLITFDKKIEELEITEANREEVNITSTWVDLQFNSDSVFFIRSKEDVVYSHINLIERSEFDWLNWNKGSGGNRTWTDSYGGSLHAEVLGSIETDDTDDDKTIFYTKENTITAHMVFPARPFNFEGLYGANSRPQVLGLRGVRVDNLMNEWDGVETGQTFYEKNEFGVIRLWADSYKPKAGTQDYPFPVYLEEEGVMGYEFANVDEINSFVLMAHQRGFKVLSYIYFPEGSNVGTQWKYPSGDKAGEFQDKEVTLQWMRGFQDEFNLDGWYLDGATIDGTGNFLINYNFIRQLRRDIGDDGIIYHHNSIDAWTGKTTLKEGGDGRRAIFIDTYVDYMLAGESGVILDNPNDPYLRFFSSGYGLSQAYGSHKISVNPLYQSPIRSEERDRVINNIYGVEIKQDYQNNDVWLTGIFKKFYDINKGKYSQGGFNPNPIWKADWFEEINDVIVEKSDGGATLKVTWTTIPDLTDSNVAYVKKSMDGLGREISVGSWESVGLGNNEDNGQIIKPELTTNHEIKLTGLNKDYKYDLRIRSMKNAGTNDEIIWGAMKKDV